MLMPYINIVKGAAFNELIPLLINHSFLPLLAIKIFFNVPAFA